MSQTVKKNMTDLKELNKGLMTKCQQKRDLLMVAVKFHYLCTQVCVSINVAVFVQYVYFVFILYYIGNFSLEIQAKFVQLKSLP